MIDYTPPTAELKQTLGLTGQQMAEFASVAGGAQWRKYTGGAQPRAVNLHMLFFMAARLTLDDAQLARVRDAMQAMGAQVGAIDGLTMPE